MSDATAAGAARGTAEVSQPPRSKRTRRSIVLRVLLLVAILGFVFAVVLPRIVDFNAVQAALANLTLGQLPILASATAVAYIASAAPSRILVQGLSWPHAVGADLAGRAVASTIPGPTDVAVKFVLYRQWAIPGDIASAGILFAEFFETLSSLVLPLIATIGVVATGGTTRPEVIWLTVISLGVLAVATLFLTAIVRSEALALRFGRRLDWLARHIWVLFRRTPPACIVDGVLEIRASAQDTLSLHGLMGFAAAVGAKLAWFLVLELSLWAVGLDTDVLSPATVLVAMAVVALVTLIPITPGAVGITETAYIGLLSAVAGSGATGQITAAVLVFRLAQWLAPILIGWALLLVMRRGHWSELMGDDHAATPPPRESQDLPAAT